MNLTIWSTISVICTNFLYLLVPCQLAKYSVGFTTYDDNSMSVSRSIEKYNEEHDARFVQLFYTTTDVKVSKTSLRVDFNTFISNVGGSLGLFIGFSVLGGFFFIYDVVVPKLY